MNESERKRITLLSPPTYKMQFKASLEDGRRRTFRSWKEVFRHKDQIKSLHLVDGITSIPRSIGKLKNLRELYCDKCSLRSLPSSIGDLTKLEELYCQSNFLSTLPRSIRKLKNLRGIYCGSNDFNTLPEYICELKNLRELYCGYNGMKTLPKTLGNLENLEVLNLAVNKLTCLPESLAKLTKLEKLFLNENDLTELPDGIGNMKSLWSLSLSCNEFVSFPESIGNLTSLRYLYFYYNRLTVVPEFIGNCTNLEEFCCYNNRITSLPNSIGGLLNLRILGCHNNCLTTLPITLNNLRCLEFFNFAGNPIEYIPPNVQRLIDRVNENGNIDNQDIYHDTENVHTSSIQRSVKEAIEYLLTLRGVPIDIENLPISSLSKEVLQKSLEDPTVHSVLEVTYSDVASRVIQVIETSFREIGYQRLEQELLDGRGLCFTGSLSRLVNTLSTLDPHVNIRIADSEQISTIILYIQRSLGERYTSEEHRRLVRNNLEEHGYSSETIDEWVSHIE